MNVIVLVVLLFIMGSASPTTSTETYNRAELLTAIRHGNRQAILEAGNTGDKTLIPDLSERAKPRVLPPLDPAKLSVMNPRDAERLRKERERSIPDAGVDAARMALAKLGVKEFVEEILLEATAPQKSRVYLERKEYFVVPPTKADALRVQMEAFEKLAYIQDRSTVRTLAAFLFAVENPANYSTRSDMIFDLPSEMAMRTLSQIVENPPTISVPSNNDTHAARVRIWQQWWERNKDKYP